MVMVKGVSQREKHLHPLQPHHFVHHELESFSGHQFDQANAPFQELALQEDTGEALQEMKVQGSASCSGTFPCAWHSS